MLEVAACRGAAKKKKGTLSLCMSQENVAAEVVLFTFT
jgi:hypothetical protein